MNEMQRQGLVADIARVLDEPGPWPDLIEGARIKWGADRDEVAEVVLNLDHLAAAQYEREYPTMVAA